MNNRVACIILNYNLRDRADALYRYLQERAKWPADLVLVDNGSDRDYPAVYTSVRMKENVRTTHGWLMGARYADAIGYTKHGEPPFAYWFISASTEIVCKGDPVKKLVMPLLVCEYDAVQPAFTGEMKAWTHLKMSSKQTRGYDDAELIGPAAMFKRDAFWKLDLFNPYLTHSWGLDFQISNLLKDKIAISYDVKLRVKENILYKKGLAGMTADERQHLASEEMNSVLESEYGAQWREVLNAIP